MVGLGVRAPEGKTRALYDRMGGSTGPSCSVALGGHLVARVFFSFTKRDMLYIILAVFLNLIIKMVLLTLDQHAD